ncbi:MAG TPA: permease-like cell division protein FtsX [Vicinamibacterales bacterium]|nr:permease-like cell division protein FtsX [Vicinamibacterales bacterium]
MKHALQYFFSEAAASLWRRRTAAALAILTIAAGLFVLGVFLLLTSNAGRLINRWTEAAELSIFLRDDVTSEQLGVVEEVIDRSAVAANREFVSKEEARRRFRRDFRDLAVAADSLDTNPFPASVEVRLRGDVAVGQSVDELTTRLRSTPGVADVRFDRRWLERLLGAITVLRGAGLFVVIVLGLAAALTVANVVRLAAHARRDEIEIMQLVGAPAAYVRGPFIAEGVLQGGAGALAGLLLLWIGFAVANARYGRLASEALGVESLTFLPVGLALAILGGGMLLGCLGGYIAARGVRTS